VGRKGSRPRPTTCKEQEATRDFKDASSAPRQPNSTKPFASPGPHFISQSGEPANRRVVPRPPFDRAPHALPDRGR